MLRGLWALLSRRIKRHPMVLALCPSILCVALALMARQRGGSVIAITSEGDPRLSPVLDPQRDVMLAMPSTTALLTPIVMTIPLQLLAYHIAVRRGCDVDQPRNLAKSVTVE